MMQIAIPSIWHRLVFCMDIKKVV